MNEDQYMHLDFSDILTDPNLSRRDFLKTVGTGIVIFFFVGDGSVLEAQRRGRALPDDFNAFLRVGADGRVTCFTGKIEMGQGVVTSLAQMLAEELDVRLESVDMIMGDTDLCPWDMGTWGSMSTRFFGPPLRAAGAEARKILIDLAAEHLGLHVENPWDMLEKIRHAGAVFLGPYAPETLGDYWAGPNHILPTGRTARFSSPLGTEDFQKVSTLTQYSKEALSECADPIITFAEKEGLDGHANAVRQRIR